MGRTLKDEGGKPLSNEKSKQESRRRLLEAAVRLLGRSENAPRALLNELKITEICEEARPPLSTGAFYSHWPQGLKDFAPDFLVHLQEEDYFQFPRPPSAPGERAIADYEALRDEPLWIAQLHLLITHHRDQRLVDVCKQGYRLSDQDTQDYYSEFIPDSDPDDITQEEFARILQALVEGMALRSLVDPEAIENPDRHLFEVAVRRILGTTG